MYLCMSLVQEVAQTDWTQSRRHVRLLNATDGVKKIDSKVFQG